MDKEKTLDFTPFSQSDVNELLDVVPVVNGKISAYKVNTWFNSKTQETTFGIMCKIDKKWLFMCNNERALIFSDKKTANMVCQHFKNGLISI